MKSIAGWSGTPAHDANPSFRAPQVDIEKFERVFPGFLDTVKDLHRHMYGPAYWRRFLEQTSQLWLTLPSYSDDALASIPVPTLVLTGDRDEEPLAQAPRLYRTIPRAELAVIPGADHAAVERSLFRDVVLDFLARHSEATRPLTGARFQTQEQEQGDPSCRDHTVASVTVSTLLSVAVLAAQPLLIREARRTKAMRTARGVTPYRQR
jgi:Alpha/beta hydrolase family